jgi:tetratricopeptide (TPR) repeat protein
VIRVIHIVCLGLVCLSGPVRAQADGGPDAGVPAVEAQAEQEATGPVRIGWFEVVPAGPSVTGIALEAARRSLAGLPADWLRAPELLEALRAWDREQGLLSKAGGHLQKGRKLHLGLKLDEAQAAYRAAIAELEKGFARYYAPSVLAEPLLQLGVARFQAGQKAEATKTFMRVAALAPQLKLAQGYYSPSVRKAYQEAVEGLGPREPGLPTPDELGRICQALGLAGLVTAEAERLGDRPLLKLGVFDAKARAFVTLETAVLADDASDKAGRDLADRLEPALADAFGLQRPETEAAPGLDGGVAAEEPLEVPDAGLAVADVAPADPGPHWAVEYWWIWPVVGGVVAASLAVALPLTVFREDVVDVRVRY